MIGMFRYFPIVPFQNDGTSPTASGGPGQISWSAMMPPFLTRGVRLEILPDALVPMIPVYEQ